MSSPLREARIDLGALRSNLAVIEAATATPLMAVVKANAYGHGMVPVAKAAVEGGASWLGVVDIDEALELRREGVTAPILCWLHPVGADFAAAIAAGVDLGISSLAQLDEVAEAGVARVQLKVDTGLSRNGIPLADASAVFERAAALQASGRIVVTGIFSHLANAGAAEDSLQVERFETALATAAAAGIESPLRHLAASAGALRVAAARYDLVRVGIGMYGLTPFDDESGASIGLRPVMELAGSIAAVRRVAAGSGVSYGFTHRTTRDTTLALVPLGYAEGVPRSASGRASVSVRGVKYPVVGRIAMDQFIIDVGDDEVVVGDRVVLWGDPATGVPSADDWAEAAGSINYEIVTRVGPRAVRTYLP